MKKKSSTTTISIRLTTQERTLLEERAGSEILSAYLRSELLGSKSTRRKTRGRAPVKDHVALSQALGLLGRSGIAQSLNELLAAVAKGELVLQPQELEDLTLACVYVAEIRNELMRALGIKED